MRSANGLRVLVAEDNVASQKVISAMLESAGHEVIVVGTGRQALAMLQGPAAGQPFDLVLMDVQMSEMNGLETTVAIRELEKGTGHHIPIVALTAHALRGDRERCLAAGMDDYLSKPIQRTELQRVIEKYGGPRGSAAQAVAPTAPYESSTLNLNAIREIAGANVELLREILELFPGESARLMGDLEQAVSRRDLERIERAAHSLKGMLGSLCAEDAHQAALRLEQLGRVGDLDQANGALVTLQNRMRELQRAIEQACRELP